MPSKTQEFWTPIFESPGRKGGGLRTPQPPPNRRGGLVRGTPLPGAFAGEERSWKISREKNQKIIPGCCPPPLLGTHLPPALGGSQPEPSLQKGLVLSERPTGHGIVPQSHHLVGGWVRPPPSSPMPPPSWRSLIGRTVGSSSPPPPTAPSSSSGQSDPSFYPSRPKEMGPRFKMCPNIPLS